MKNDSHTKHVTNRLKMHCNIPRIDNFRGNISRRPASHIQMLLLISPGRKSEVSDHAFKAPTAPHQNVFGLQIPVHYSFGVQMLQPTDQTSHKTYDLTMSEFVFAFNKIKQLPTLDQFQTQIYGTFRLKHLEELQEVSVVQHPHDFYLVKQGCFSIFLSKGIFLRKCFNCKFPIVLHSQREIYSCEVTLSDLLYGFIEFMEASLVEFCSQHLIPMLQLPFLPAMQCQLLILPLKANAQKLARDATLTGVPHHRKEQILSKQYPGDGASQLALILSADLILQNIFLVKGEHSIDAARFQMENGGEDGWALAAWQAVEGYGLQYRHRIEEMIVLTRYYASSS